MILFIKKILLFTVLFVLSCGNNLTPSDKNEDSDGNGDLGANLTFLDYVDGKLLVDSDGYYISPYSEDGKIYRDPLTKLPYPFVKDISKTKRIYKLRGRESYYGHEIRSGVLYVTDIPSNNIDSIDWVAAKKIGSFVNDYSAEFLNNVKGKKLSGCENYFDSNTGRVYLAKFSNIEDKFNFVQALSSTKAIYENEQNGGTMFIGLSTVGTALSDTEEVADISSINWDALTTVGNLLE